MLHDTSRSHRRRSDPLRHQCRTPRMKYSGYKVHARNPRRAKSEVKRRCLQSESQGSKVIFSHRFSSGASTVNVGAGGLVCFSWKLKRCCGEASSSPPTCIVTLDFSAALAWNDADLVACGEMMNVYTSRKQLWEGRSGRSSAVSGKAVPN